MQHRLFAFGLGFSALALVERLRLSGGWQFAGTCRDAAKAERLGAAGLSPYRLGPAGATLDAAAALAGTTHLLLSAPPGDQGDPVLAAHAPALTALARAGSLRWVGYLSTTGVYGDRAGGWVDETSPCTPGQLRSQRRLEAEHAWRDWARSCGVPLQIFRLSGIYGPGRSAVDDVRAGTARRMEGPPGHVFCRIHVDDIAGVLQAAIGAAAPEPGAVFNLADDRPCPSAEVVEAACRLLGVPPPPLQPFRADLLSAMGQSFYAECRRVRNDRIKTDLGYRLMHPDYRSGLAACLPGPRGLVALA